jgi:hypothetical protein
MQEASMPLTALSEAQRAQALERFTIIRPALEAEVSHKRSFLATPWPGAT